MTVCSHSGSVCDFYRQSISVRICIHQVNSTSWTITPSHACSWYTYQTPPTSRPWSRPSPDPTQKNTNDLLAAISSTLRFISCQAEGEGKNQSKLMNGNGDHKRLCGGVQSINSTCESSWDSSLPYKAYISLSALLQVMHTRTVHHTTKCWLTVTVLL